MELLYEAELRAFLASVPLESCDVDWLLAQGIRTMWQLQQISQDALLCMKQEHTQRLLTLLKDAMQKRDAEALYNCGWEFKSGGVHGSSRDHLAAMQKWEKAAELGHAAAQFWLRAFRGDCAADGDGKGLEWYAQEAAEQGWGRSLCCLAYEYSHSRSAVAGDKEQAMSLYGAAARCGDTHSKIIVRTYLGSEYAQNTSLQRRERSREALSLFKVGLPVSPRIVEQAVSYVEQDGTWWARALERFGSPSSSAVSSSAVSSSSACTRTAAAVGEQKISKLRYQLACSSITTADLAYATAAFEFSGHPGYLSYAIPIKGIQLVVDNEGTHAVFTAPFVFRINTCILDFDQNIATKTFRIEDDVVQVLPSFKQRVICTSPREDQAETPIWDEEFVTYEGAVHEWKNSRRYRRVILCLTYKYLVPVVAEILAALFGISPKLAIIPLIMQY